MAVSCKLNVKLNIVLLFCRNKLVKLGTSKPSLLPSTSIPMVCTLEVLCHVLTLLLSTVWYSTVIYSTVLYILYYTILY